MSYAMSYAMWYDNGSGYFEGHEEVNSIVFDNPYRQVATLGWKQNPNENPQHILAESGDVVRLYDVTLNGEEGVDQSYDFCFETQAKSGETAMTAAQLYHGCVAICFTEVLPKAILVGRHASDDLPYEIIDQRPVVFATEISACIEQVEELFEAAFKADAVLLFQNVPGILACAFARIAARSAPTHLKGVGVIISKPGPRPAGVQLSLDPYTVTVLAQNDMLDDVVDLIKHVNPNAQIDGGTVTVDPPMKFVFDKVEWLY